jgi:peptidoglycan lytic transglycosylase
MQTVSKAPGRVAVLALLVTTLCLLLTDSSVTFAARRHRGHARARARHAAPTVGAVLVGRATWYGPGFHGHRTASGERFNRNALTLASRGLPMQTMVRVTNLKTGRSAIGRVNDRGPYSHGAIVDLSEALARRVGMLGTSRVRIQVLGSRQKY